MITPIPDTRPHTEAQRPKSTTRLRSLDGLRGLAAVAVLLHHSLLVVPSLAAPYYSGGPIKSTASWEWWLVHTPLHVLWEGKGAVYIFFVLSGLVLALPVFGAIEEQQGKYRWLSFYPQRMVRLYVPVWAAGLFTTLTFLLVPRLGEVASDWMRERPRDLTFIAFIKDMTLIFGNGGLASPLWSLRFEILFSLALPIFVGAAILWPRAVSAKIMGCVLIVSVGGLLRDSGLLYLPMFMIGILLGKELPRLRLLAGKLDGQPQAQLLWSSLVLASILLINAKWFILLFPAPSQFADASSGLVLIGATLAVFVSVGWFRAHNILTARPVQWLGEISFSLYLVHEPIVVACGYFFGPGREALAVATAILISFGFAAAFYRLVELPSHKLAKAVRRMATPSGK